MTCYMYEWLYEVTEEVEADVLRGAGTDISPDGRDIRSDSPYSQVIPTSIPDEVNAEGEVSRFR